MGKLNTLKEIQNWLDGPKDYDEGRELLKTIPGGILTNYQLTNYETYENRVRLEHWLKKGIEILKQDLG
jgi:hypothetical protein